MFVNFGLVSPEIVGVKVWEGEVGVAPQGQVWAEPVLVHQFRDELGSKSNDEGLYKKIIKKFIDAVKMYQFNLIILFDSLRMSGVNFIQ